MPKSPDAFRTISEVADWLGIQTHVLRFWESKFTQVKPVKRAGGRRYYRPVDMLLLGGIKKLLHEDGLTIKGVQKILREEGMTHVSDMSEPLDEATSAQLVDKPVDGAALPVMPPAPEEKGVVLSFEAPGGETPTEPDLLSEPSLPLPDVKDDVPEIAAGLAPKPDAPPLPSVSSDMTHPPEITPTTPQAEIEADPDPVASAPVDDALDNSLSADTLVSDAPAPLDDGPAPVDEIMTQPPAAAAQEMPEGAAPEPAPMTATPDPVEATLPEPVATTTEDAPEAVAPPVPPKETAPEPTPITADAAPAPAQKAQQEPDTLPTDALPEPSGPETTLSALDDTAAKDMSAAPVDAMHDDTDAAPTTVDEMMQDAPALAAEDLPETIDVDPAPLAAQEPTAAPPIEEPIPVVAEETPATAEPSEAHAPQPPDEDSAPEVNLPAFLRRPLDPAPPVEPTDNMAAAPEPAVEMAPEPTPPPPAPKPRILEIGPLPKEADFDVKRSTLGHAYRLRNCSPEAAQQIKPLLTRLTTLRDAMAAVRRIADAATSSTTSKD